MFKINIVSGLQIDKGKKFLPSSPLLESMFSNTNVTFDLRTFSLYVCCAARSAAADVLRYDLVLINQ